jgi:protein-L-isoaspartate(D-aspartate) O-methyltransferase
MGDHRVVTGAATAEQLHEDLVRELRAAGHAWRDPVHRALRAVPRHLFVPEVPLEEAYAAGKAVVTKRDARGAPLSSASAPGIVALMLDQLDVRAGHRVLEIGSGTGYNAALLAELTGPEGRVVTIDIDPGCTRRTRDALARTGHPEVDVRTGDGTLGTPDGSAFDRIIVTAGAWDIPPAWFDQLTVGGRLVVPLRWRRQSQSVAFVREPDRLRSDGLALAGFIPMDTPDGEHRGRIGRLDTGEPIILVRDADQSFDLGALSGILGRPGDAAWSGVTVGQVDPFHGVWLRLTTDPRACWLLAARPITMPDGGATVPVIGPALADGSSLAFFTFRRTDGKRAELGTIGYGPSGAALAQVIVRHIRAWDTSRDVLPELTAHPAGTPDDALPGGAVIEKHHTRLVITYPPRQPVSSGTGPGDLDGPCSDADTTVSPTGTR